MPAYFSSLNLNRALLGPLGLFVYGFGLPLVLMGGLAVVLRWRRRTMSGPVLISMCWIAAALFFHSLMAVGFARYLLKIVPPILFLVVSLPLFRTPFKNARLEYWAICALPVVGVAHELLLFTCWWPRNIIVVGMAGGALLVLAYAGFLFRAHKTDGHWESLIPACFLACFLVFQHVSARHYTAKMGDEIRSRDQTTREVAGYLRSTLDPRAIVVLPLTEFSYYARLPYINSVEMSDSELDELLVRHPEVRAVVTLHLLPDRLLAEHPDLTLSHVFDGWAYVYLRTPSIITSSPF